MFLFCLAEWLERKLLIKESICFITLVVIGSFDFESLKRGFDPRYIIKGQTRDILTI